MTDGQLTAVLAFLAAGGTGLFAFFKWAITQWREERSLERDDRSKDRTVLVDLQLDVRALVIQSQRRDERRRLTEPPLRRSVPAGEFDDRPTTDIVEIQREQREANPQFRIHTKTPSRGVRNTPNEDR